MSALRSWAANADIPISHSVLAAFDYVRRAFAAVSPHSSLLWISVGVVAIPFIPGVKGNAVGCAFTYTVLVPVIEILTALR